MNSEQFDFIENEVKAILERDSTSSLLDYLESEFEFLKEEIPDIESVIYKDSFSQIEKIVKSGGKSLTNSEKKEVLKIVFTATFQHLMYFKSLSNELNET